MLRLMRDVGTEVSANDTMPGRVVLPHMKQAASPRHPQIPHCAGPSRKTMRTRLLSNSFLMNAAMSFSILYLDVPSFNSHVLRLWPLSWKHELNVPAEPLRKCLRFADAERERFLLQSCFQARRFAIPLAQQFLRPRKIDKTTIFQSVTFCQSLFARGLLQSLRGTVNGILLHVLLQCANAQRCSSTVLQLEACGYMSRFAEIGDPQHILSTMRNPRRGPQFPETLK